LSRNRWSRNRWSRIRWSRNRWRLGCRWSCRLVFQDVFVLKQPV